MGGWTPTELLVLFVLLACTGGFISLTWREHKAAKPPKQQEQPTTPLSRPQLPFWPLTVTDQMGANRAGRFLLGLTFTGEKPSYLVGSWSLEDAFPDGSQFWCGGIDTEGTLSACPPDQLERIQREVIRLREVLARQSEPALRLLLRDLAAQQKRSKRLATSTSPLGKQEAKMLDEAMKRTLTRLGEECSIGSCLVAFLPQPIGTNRPQEGEWDLHCNTLTQLCEFIVPAGKPAALEMRKETTDETSSH